MLSLKIREFNRPLIGALRNTQGNNAIVRLFDFRLIHDLRLDELAAAKKLKWDIQKPYMVVWYPASKDILDSSGRISAFIPPASFEVQTFEKWVDAEDVYLIECKSQTGKSRKKWPLSKENISEYE